MAELVNPSCVAPFASYADEHGIGDIAGLGELPLQTRSHHAGWLI